MTSTQVMGTRANFMDALIPVSNSTKSDAGDFKSFLNFQNNKNNLENISQPVRTVDRKNENIKEEVKTDKAVETSSVSTVRANKPERQVEESDVTDVKKAISKVIDTIKEELNVTDEDIENAMEALGLIPVDLLLPTKMIDFVVEVTETENPIMLATDENLLESLNKLETEVTNILEDLCQALDLDVESFTTAIKNFEQDINPEEVLKPLEGELVDENTIIPFEKETEVVSEVVENNELPLVENVNPEKKENVKEDKVESIIHNFSVHNNSENQEKTRTVSQTGEKGKEELFHEGQERPANDILSFANNLVKETVVALNENVSQVTFTTVDATRIINQITESIKTQVTAESTEVNMKLHPESLGNVSVKITTNNEGLMTAKFMAENESVKSVIEAQASTLKETLESKGVTVEAVEVMVASHRFDESFDRERGNNNNPSQKKNVRRINLDDEEAVDGTDADIEAENLAKDIMRQNGNTIDYTA